MSEIVGRQDTGRDHVAAFRRHGAEVAETDADSGEDPEELLEQRTVGARTDLRGVEPRQDEHHRDRAEHQDDAAELVRNRAKDRVERQEVPLRNDMRRSDQRIRLDVVVGVTQEVRDVEHEVGEQDHEHHDREQVLDRVVRMERDRVLLGLRVDARRVVVAGGVERPHVQQNDAEDHERQQVVQREEAVQRRVCRRRSHPTASSRSARRPAAAPRTGW